MKSSFLQRLRIDGASPPSYVEGMTRNDAAGPIIVFDAECILCSANAQFVLRHDRARRFRLASMQNAIGAALYRRFGIDPANPESMIIVDGDRLLKDSDAVLAIYAGLGWPWKALSLLRFIPRGNDDCDIGKRRLDTFNRTRAKQGNPLKISANHKPLTQKKEERSGLKGRQQPCGHDFRPPAGRV